MMLCGGTASEPARIGCLAADIVMFLLYVVEKLTCVDSTDREFQPHLYKFMDKFLGAY